MIKTVRRGKPNGIQGVTYKASHCRDVTDQIVIDDGLNAMGVNEIPCVFGSLTIGLSINSDLSEGILIEVLHEGVDDIQYAGSNKGEETENDIVTLHPMYN